MDKNVLVYEGDKGVRLMVKCDGETVWLTIDQMSALFGRDPSVIGKHIKAAFSEEELDDSINRQNLPINGRGRPVTIYDLDVVISVGSLANHEEEVYAAWNLAIQGQPFEKIKVTI